MKILHLVEHVREAGNGGVNVAVDLACLQADLGHRVGVVSKGGDYEKLLRQHGVQHFKADQSSKLGKYIQYLKQYIAAMRDFQPDIVHSHTMVSVTAAWLLKNLGRYRLVATVHNEFQKSAVLMGLADKVIVVSKAGARLMHQRGISKQKLCVVLNANIGSPRFRPLASCRPLLIHSPAIVTVAGLHIRKGHIELIKAFEKIAARFPKAHLYLVGDGSGRAQIEAAANQTSVTHRIHFEGFQPEPQKYLLSSDIFVLASHREPFGLAIAEAREAGCAVIASNVDGIPEVVERGKAGILFEAQNVDALATVIADLLGDQKKLEFWQQQAKKNLGWLKVDRLVQETLAVYQQLTPDNTSAITRKPLNTI
ncbi:glycosyltransferase family 4 protein [Nodosilinea sp. E11]|uniref:glycosyltransferase family 4 protein n=1 Tax=Nodosilinea sp. E11 TaxID=3037479 RepID=UPI00293412EF|nr:glycosyltransferase family 4 protein [Nodosilinea sp. E11]WOD39262.1 glycosyltransferase family 4 protein [Nodosilinea sp. E11]